jgi:hypothetical protein
MQDRLSPPFCAHFDEVPLYRSPPRDKWRITDSFLHHFRMPREHEEQNENKKTSADEDQDGTKDGDEPVEKRFSPKPVGNHADDRDWLEDSQHQVNDVGIVELVMIGQPAARDEMSIHSGANGHMNNRN